MQKNDIVDFLTLLGCENVEASEGSEWVKASCPVAPWFHKNGTDRHPSFGVKIPEDPSKEAFFHCFACERSGSLEKLLFLLTSLSGNWNKEAARFLSTKDFSLEERKEEIDRKRRVVRERFAEIKNSEIVEMKAVPDDILEKYPLLSEGSYSAGYAALRWLSEERKITFGAIERHKLRLYIEGSDIGIVFPILSRNGELVLDMHVRLFPEKRFFRLSPELTGSRVDYKASHLFFGNHIIDPTKPVILVEGALDCLRLNSFGQWNVLATMGSISKNQIEFLYARSAYVAFDADEAGREKAKRAIRLLAQRLAFVYWVDWSTVGVKDPGDLISVLQFQEAIKKAVPCMTDWQQKKKYLKKFGNFDKINARSRRDLNQKAEGERKW